MRIHPLHPWNLTPKDAIALQKKLAPQIDTRSPLTKYDLIAGADVSHRRFSNLLFAGVVLMRADDFSIVEQQSAVAETTFPYVPGLLSFREAPVLLEAFAKLRRRPDVVMIDGHGIAHPRRLGIAAHLGLWLNVPTVGCAKSLLTGKFAALGPKPGAIRPLLSRRQDTFVASTKGKNEVIGSVVRTRLRCNPLFVSPGHRIDLAGTVRLVLNSCRGYRLPEPTRQAHLFVNAVRLSAEPSEPEA